MDADAGPVSSRAFGARVAFAEDLVRVAERVRGDLAIFYLPKSGGLLPRRARRWCVSSVYARVLHQRKRSGCSLLLIFSVPPIDRAVGRFRPLLLPARLTLSYLRLPGNVQPYLETRPKVDIRPHIGYSPRHIGDQRRSDPSARLFGFSKAGPRKVGGDIFEFSVVGLSKEIPITTSRGTTSMATTTTPSPLSHESATG